MGLPFSVFPYYRYIIHSGLMLDLRRTKMLPLILWMMAGVTEGLCPGGIQLPCTCASTQYEPVSIVCDGASKLAVVLSAIGTPTQTIDSLIITNTPIDTLPAYAFQGYTIKRLVFRSNNMRAVDPRAFEGALLNSLLELEIRNNKIDSIPQQGISSLRNLRTLILAKNGITFVPPKVFANYSSRNVMRKLDLSSNRIQNFNSEDTFEGLLALEEISLDKNFLSAIPTEALKRLSTLEDLSLGVNQLKYIPLGSLAFPNLKSLSLEVNQIQYIQPETFRGAPNLLYLYLSANKFSEIDPNMFKYIPKLKVLALGNNEGIEILPSNAFQNIPGLVRLELSECSIDTIGPGSFQKMPKIQVIVLNKNRLTTISRTDFQGLTELISLDLKGNDISYVGNRAFSGLPALKHLDISTNQLGTLQFETFSGTFMPTNPPTSRVMYIYENPWVCDTRLEWFRSWLRTNSDVQIDAPGYPPTLCLKPQFLFRHPIRSRDPSPPAGPKPSPPKITSQITAKPNNNKPETEIKTPLTPAANLQNEGETNIGTSDNPNTKISGVNLAAVVLGIILGIMLLSVLLLMVVRYFVGKNRRDRKEEDEEARRLGSSTISGYNSAYPSPASLAPESMMAPHRQSGGYFLNRPWYWWF